MSYAGSRTMLDADSHVMESVDFLDGFIDEADRARLKRHRFDALEPAIARGRSLAESRRLDADKSTLAEERLLEDKGWFAMGASDPVERSHTLDLLGFKAQLVFATFASVLYTGRDESRLYAGAAAQNRAMADFCRHDPRLLAVAYVPLSDPVRATALAEEAVALGCAAVMVPSTAAGDRSPTHPDLDGFWGTLEASDTPFVLHVGGGGRLLDPAFLNNAMPVSDHLGGGENIRSKDYLAIHHSPEVFLGALVLDGIFDRFPRLRGGCIEQGAGWVVSFLRHIDYAQRAFRRTEEPLRRLADRPSEYVRRHLKFTPFPGEPVGWMIEQAGAELFMFSSDYPHPEGGKDPIAKFDQELTGISEADQARFYAGNMAELMGSRLPEKAL